MSVEQVNVSRFELLMDAGFGAQKAGDILIRCFAHTGRYVFIEPMIPAEISPPPRTKPALSGSIVRTANFPLTNIGNDTNIILAQHEIVLDRRLDDDEHNPSCRVLLDMSDQSNNQESYEKVCQRIQATGLNIYPIEVTSTALQDIKSLGGKGKNMYYMGLLAEIYSLPEAAVIKEINSVFGKRLREDILAKNIEIFHEGYQYARDHIHFAYNIEASVQSDQKQLLIDGNSALSMGIIDAGIKLASGYPITPASSILHSLAKVFPKHGGMVHQAEDEISAIGTAIGAYFSGVPAITATSGPGLSLKQEFIGYAMTAEVPLIVVDVQRSGPSTGMPTKTEQSDLLAAIYGCHGDNAKIVISVADILDCFYAPHLARYFAEHLHVPVFIMSDFQTANSYTVTDTPELVHLDRVEEIPDFVLDHFGVERLPAEIEMVRTRQDIPGAVGGMRRVTGLNTNEEGSVNYFAKTNQRSHAVRNEKVHHVRRAVKHPEMVGDVHEGDLLVVGWGSTRGAIEEAVLDCQKAGLKVGGMAFRIIYPLPLMLDEIFSKFKRVVTVELAYGDDLKRTPLSMFLRSKTLADVNPMISRATGRPISPMTIETEIKEILHV